MAQTLKQNVFVDGEWYGPAYGNEDVSEATAKAITNKAAFESVDEGAFDLTLRDDDRADGPDREAELKAMDRDELVAEAERLGVSFPSSASKAQIVKAILAAE